MRAPKGQKMRRQNGLMDRWLFLLVLAMMFFGVIMVFSASAPYALKQYGDGQYFFIRDLIFTVAAVFVLLIFSRINYRLYRKYALGIFLLSWLSCLLVFVPGLRAPLNNAYRWIDLGPITIMPSDILKVGSVIGMSAFLTQHPITKNGTLITLLRVFFIVGLTILPVFLQPNFSAVVVIAMTLLFLYFIGGMRIWHLVPLGALAATGFAAALMTESGRYRMERVLSVLDPTKDPTGDSWQLIQSLYAVASGGLFGVGYGDGRQKFGYLAAEPHNDFIFAVISEELGFVGAMLVILAFAFLTYRGVRIAQRAKTAFGRLLGYGLTFVISFQAMVNIGVAIGVVPTTGITLPFISYGGSSLLIMSAMVGVLLNISRDSEDVS